MSRFSGLAWSAVCMAGLVAGAISCDKGTDNSATPGAPGATGKKQTIAVIAKSTVNAYWNAVHDGATQAATEFNVDIRWDGPDAETAHSAQANLVDNMVNSGVDGIVIAPTNVDALVRPIESAVGKGVPVILIDSTLNSDKPLSVIATDNFAAGQQAAEALIKAIGTKKKYGGKVIVLRFLEGSGSTEAREKGFIERIKKEGLEVAANDYTKGGGSTTDAAETAQSLLSRFTKDGALQVDGVFASNQPTAKGMLDSLAKLKAGGTTIDAPYVGFDADDVLLAGIRDGRIAALVVQDPKQMGYLGVKAMVSHLKGEKIEKAIPTATATVTKENVDLPATKAITLEK